MQNKIILNIQKSFASFVVIVVLIGNEICLPIEI